MRVALYEKEGDNEVATTNPNPRRGSRRKAP
jgi:hypothetical protein